MLKKGFQGQNDDRMRGGGEERTGKNSKVLEMDSESAMETAAIFYTFVFVGWVWFFFIFSLSLFLFFKK